MFIDRAKIQVRAGDGGHGCVSFRREKFVPRGGPSGGDGGRGGSVILRADVSRSTLNDFHYRQHFIAERGGHGEGSQCSGRSGADVEVVVPPGTVVFAAEGGEILADLAQPGETYFAVRGGRGGRGNARFASATNQAPRHAEDGREGGVAELRLELRVLAEIGLVGYPNVGKSTLLSRLTAARPKVADYPFTTLTPHLGVADLDGSRSTVMADIPGLIEGAHEGAGLGARFLQHLGRTRILLHLVDAASMEGRDPLKDYLAIRTELEAYGAGLECRPEQVLLARCDLLQDAERGQALEQHLRAAGRPAPLPVSGVTGAGLGALRGCLLHLLDRLPPLPAARLDADAPEPDEEVITLREKRS